MKSSWRYVVFAAITGMEICWLYVLLTLINTAVANRLAVWGLLLVYFVSFGLNKAIRRIYWNRALLTLLSWLLWVIVMLLSVKIQLYRQNILTEITWLASIPQALSNIFIGVSPELLILIVTPILWWLGKRLAHLKSGFAASVSEFQLGLILLLSAFTIISLLALEFSSLLLVTFCFVACALLGISIAHAREGESWITGLYQGHWVGLLVISICFILFIGLAISMIINQNLLQLILSALKYIWFLIERVLLFLASLLPNSGEMPPLPTVTPEPSEPSTGDILRIPDWLRQVLQLVWLILAGGVVLFAVWRVSSQIFAWMRRRMASSGAEFESLSGTFKPDLLNWLKRLFFKLFGIKLFRPKKVTGSMEVASIRQLYSQLLRWTSAGGYPRKLYQTPDEFRSALSGTKPEIGEDLNTITEEYTGARYGLYVPNVEALQKAKESLHRIRQNRFNKR